MLVPTLIMAGFALLLFFIGYRKNLHLTGLRYSLNMLIEILPLLVFAFIVAGMVQALLPRQTLANWIGQDSGLRGIFIGTIAGALTPGGPYTSMPIAAGLLRTGASIGTMVAFMTAWSLWAFSRLPIEIGILGLRFAFIRILSVLFFPALAGIIAQALSKLIK